MAIFLRSNVVALVRSSNCPYWKIYENESKKAAGNFVASCDFANPDLGINAACDDLLLKLQYLAQGRYILTAYEKNDGKRKGIDSWIELEPLSGSYNPIAGIGSTDSNTGFVIAGFGVVTADNFEQAIDKKMADALKKQKEADEHAALLAENKALKEELKENESGIKKSLLAIGTVIYPHVSKSPHFKDVLGLVGSVTKMGTDTPATPSGTPQTLGEIPDNHIEGETAEIGGVAVNQDRLFGVLDKLGKNNPDVLEHLEKLAALKERDPEMYTTGVDFIDNM